MIRYLSDGSLSVPVNYYKIFRWGEPVGTGVSDSRWINVTGVAKTALEAERRIVANELICSRLAAAIFLPTPPGFLVREEGEPWFVSLKFNIAGAQLPPVQPERLVAARPTLASAIVIFDMWVVNPDRHDRNLAFDVDSGAVGVFDHSRALAPLNVALASYLATRVDDLGIGDHCLAPFITSWEGISDCADRIAQIPDFIVREAVKEGVEVGLDQRDGALLEDFLLRRRHRLLDLVDAHANRFPSLQLPLLPLDDTDRSDNGPAREALSDPAAEVVDGETPGELGASDAQEAVEE